MRVAAFLNMSFKVFQSTTLFFTLFFTLFLTILFTPFFTILFTPFAGA